MSPNHISDLDFVGLDIIIDVQREICPSDMVSLVFLLYDDPQLALKELTIYQRVIADEGNSSNILFEWAAKTQSRYTWKMELVEALATCQLYNVTQKLGLNLQTVKQLFQKNKNFINCSTSISPMRKILYRVCENMNSTTLSHFKKIISSCFNIPDHDNCEMIFLELMCKNFFTKVNNSNTVDIRENVKKLLHLLSEVPDCSILCSEMRVYIDNLFTEDTKIFQEVPTNSKPNLQKINYNKHYVEDFTEEYQLLNKLSLENIYVDYKSD